MQVTFTIGIYGDDAVERMNTIKQAAKDRNTSVSKLMLGLFYEYMARESKRKKKEK